MEREVIMIDEDYSIIHSSAPKILGQIHEILVTAENKMKSEDIGDIFYWWIFTQETNLDELDNKTNEILEELTQLKIKIENHIKNHVKNPPKTYSKFITNLKVFIEQNQLSLNKLYNYLKWLSEKNPILPNMLYDFEFWRSDRNDITSRALQEIPANNPDLMKYWIEFALGLRDSIGYTLIKNEGDVEYASWDVLRLFTLYFRNLRKCTRKIVSKIKICREAKVKEYDVFICHASEDKKEFVDSLANHLLDIDLRVWYDKFELHLGDSLPEKISEGLKSARYGVVVLSKAFFGKKWAQWELDELTTFEMAGRNRILPIWYKVTKEDILQYSQPLAIRLGVSSDEGVFEIGEQILAIVHDSLPGFIGW